MYSQKCYRILLTGGFIFSSSYDKTAKVWIFDTENLDAGQEKQACLKTFRRHKKGVYPLIFIPAEVTLEEEITGREDMHTADIIITGSADKTARSWSFRFGDCLKVHYMFSVIL